MANSMQGHFYDHHGSMSRVTSQSSHSNSGKTILRSECRACLKNDGIMPIFGDEARPDISMEIETFGGIQLKEDDDFPKFICEDCFKMLETAITFRKSCKRCDASLKRRKRKEAAQEIFDDNTDTITDKHEQSIIEEFELPKFETNTDGMYNVEEQSSKANTDNIVIEYIEEPQDINDIKIDFDSVILSCPESVPFVKNEGENDNEDTHDHHSNNEESNDSDDEPLKKAITPKLKPDFFSCKYCNRTFQTLDNYEEHRTTVEHKRNYIMSFLPKKKKEPSQARKPIPKNHPCEICKIPFTKKQYAKHMLAEHNIKIELSKSAIKKECTICKGMFHPAFLSTHMKRKHGTEKEVKPKIKLECPVCKKLFSKHFYPLHLQRHKQGDTRNYICDQCGKKFFYKSSFFTHRLIHSNNLPHKCGYCPYRGRTKELLKIHVRTHTGDYPYKCPQCETRCLTKSNLNSHMRRHRGPVDFICDACNRGFYSKTQLERHIEVSHYGHKNHICSICGAAFGYRHGLMSHQRKVHKRPKGMGKPKAVYLQLAEEGLLQPEQ